MRGLAFEALATVLFFLAAAGFIAAAISGSPPAVRVLCVVAGVVVLLPGGVLYRRGWRLVHRMGRPTARQHHPGRPSFTGRFAAATWLVGEDAPVLRAYAVVIAGPLLLLVTAVAVLATSAADRAFGGLPVWAVIPFQLLVVVGTTLIGDALGTDRFGQLRFGSYAAVVVSAALGAYVTVGTHVHHTGRAAVVGLVGLACLAWVVGVDVAARSGRRA